MLPFFVHGVALRGGRDEAKRIPPTGCAAPYPWLCAYAFPERNARTPDAGTADGMQPMLSRSPLTPKPTAGFRYPLRVLHPARIQWITNLPGLCRSAARSPKTVRQEMCACFMSDKALLDARHVVTLGKTE